VQTDRRLVEDVADAAQVGAELRGQPNALRLAAGQRVGRAIEGQVGQPDLFEKLQTRQNLLEDRLGDRRLARVERVRCNRAAPQ
jgi:hypothetical protein